MRPVFTAVAGLCLWAATPSMAQTFLPGKAPEPGFQVEQVDMISWRIAFQGEAGMSLKQAEETVAARVAQMTLEKGYTHFAVADSQAGEQVRSGRVPATTFGSESSTVFNMRTETETSSPSMRGTIRMYQGAPEGVARIYDAQAVCDSFGPKYGITCPPARK